MNAGASAGLVRRWVALYTHGLSRSVRSARRDEIDSDLWSQHQEGVELARSDGAIASEILTRLVLGIPADLSWRLEQARSRRSHGTVGRRATMGSRAVGLLAIVGGLALTAAVVVYLPEKLARPDVPPWQVITEPALYAIWAVLGITGMIGLSVALIGLAYVFLDRLEQGVALMPVLGGLGGFLGLIGAYGGFVLLPVGSAVFMGYLAWARLMNPWIALGHALVAAAWVVPVAISLGSRSDNGASLIGILYGMSWVLIGAWLLRGVPLPRPSASEA
jgi:hypothetical protein